MQEYYSCPFCHVVLLPDAEQLHCPSCCREYPITNGSPDFSTRAHYWNQISEAQMEVLLDIARQHGYCYAIENILGKFHDDYLVGYVLNLNRSDFRSILPLTPASEVLDLGGGWGGVACSLAPSCASLTTLDTNPYNLEFIRLRAEQSGIHNVNTVRIDPLDDARLPFPDNRFDVAILNGVLEYVGSATKGLSATEVQRRCLAEVRRVLKPGGVLYIGIENRYSCLYFMGTRDHSHLRYTSLLPRPLASLVTRLRFGTPYRTYTYSYRGYKKLLASAGFHLPDMYLAYPSYREPRFILSGENDNALLYFVRRHLAHIRNQTIRKTVQALFTHLPRRLSCTALRHVFDSYMMVAEAGE